MFYTAKIPLNAARLNAQLITTKYTKYTKRSGGMDFVRTVISGGNKIVALYLSSAEK